MNNFFKKLGLGLGAAAFMGSVAHEAKEAKDAYVKGADEARAKMEYVEPAKEDLADQEAHNPFIAENNQETSN